MFVVKRPFKNFGKTYTAGTVLTEPADIKRFKGKLAEGKIIEVTEQTYDATAKYFKDKFGVDIPSLDAITEEQTSEEQTSEEQTSEEPTSEEQTSEEQTSEEQTSEEPKVHVVNKVVATVK